MSSILHSPTKQSNTSSPIHTSQTSYPIYRATKFCQSKPKGIPFGSSSSKQPPQLAPVKGCYFQSYNGLNSVPPSQWNESRVPFGSLGNRFPEKNERSPGPTSYSIEVKSRQKKIPIGEEIKNKPLKKDDFLGPGSYNISAQQKKNEVRQKIKEKHKMVMDRYNIFKNNLRSSLDSFNFGLVEKSSQKQSKQKPRQSNNKKLPNKQNVTCNRFLLKNNTSKYLQNSYFAPKQREETHITQWKSSNYSPSFVQGNNNPYTSYLQQNCSPGPDTYQRKQLKHISGSSAVSAFSSKVDRVLFAVECSPKSKLKLSNCI